MHYYASTHSCLIYGPDRAITVPYKLSAKPDVLDIFLTKDLPYLTPCSALTLYHLPVLVDNRCRSILLNPLTPPHYRQADNTAVIATSRKPALVFQLPGSLSQLLRALAERTDLKEYRDAAHSQAHPEASSISAVREAYLIHRYSPLSGDDP